MFGSVLSVLCGLIIFFMILEGDSVKCYYFCFVDDKRYREVTWFI